MFKYKRVLAVGLSICVVLLSIMVDGASFMSDRLIGLDFAVLYFSQIM